MIIKVEIVLNLFLVFYALILFYDFFILVLNKSSDKMLQKRKEKIEKNIYDKNVLAKLLSSASYLYAFNKMLEENYLINGKTINSILEKKDYKDVIIKLANVYMNKDEIEKIYYSYTLSKVPATEGTQTFLFKVLNGNSLYGIEDSLKAIYNFKSPELISQAFLIVSHSEVIYSNRLISDGMLEYKGDKHELAEELFKNFHYYNEECQIAFVNYFRKIKYDIGDKLLELFNTNKLNKELEIAIIRYFNSVKNKNAYELFIDRLKNNYYNQFEYEVVMIQALENYNDKRVIEILTDKLSDDNYYIRYNSCMVLDKLTDISKIVVYDKYANDIIDYFIEEGRKTCKY